MTVFDQCSTLLRRLRGSSSIMDEKDRWYIEMVIQSETRLPTDVLRLQKLCQKYRA